MDNQKLLQEMNLTVWQPSRLYNSNLTNATAQQMKD